jgi:hypothetical protein
MAFRRGYEQLPFEEAIMKEDSRIKNGYPDTHRFSYVSRGFYSEQFKRYLSFFPIKNIKVTLFEEFVKDKENNIGEILNFLGCTEAFEFEINNKIHSGDLNLYQYIRAVKINRYYSLRSNVLNMFKLLTSQGKKVDYPPVRRKTRVALFDLFKNDIHELEILLNKDLSIWREY